MLIALILLTEFRLVLEIEEKHWKSGLKDYILLQFVEALLTAKRSSTYRIPSLSSFR